MTNSNDSLSPSVKDHVRVRTDLVYKEEDGKISVKDPIRIYYFRFNQLQYDMMMLLDGTRSNFEVAEALSNQYETEIPIEKIEAFIRLLDRKLLLHLSCYPEVESKALADQAKRLMRKRKLYWRGARNSSPESALFDQALAQIDKGALGRAYSYLEVVRAMNPANVRAHQACIVLEEAYFGSDRVTWWWMYQIRLFDPDRLLGFLDRYLGKFVFGAGGLILLATMVCLASPWFIDMMSSPPASFSPSDFLIAYFVLMIPEVLFHEFGHGWACKHYGGSVRDIGIAIVYFVFPGAYTDISEMFHPKQTKRNKLVAFLAGPAFHLFFFCSYVFLYHFLAEGLFLRKALFMRVALATITILTNIMPFVVGLDGYQVLATALDVPQLMLQENASLFLRGMIKQRLFGIVPEPITATRRQRIGYLIYALTGGLYTYAFSISLLLFVILPRSIRYFGTFGLLIGVFYGVMSVGKRVYEPLRDVAKFLLRERAVVFTPARSVAIAAALVVAAGLLATPIPMHIDGSMRIEPRERAFVKAGIKGEIRAIRVKDGERVEVGQVLFELDDPDLVMEREEIRERLAVGRAALALLVAGSRPEEITATVAALSGSTARGRQASLDASRARRLREADVMTDASEADARHEATRADDDTLHLRRTLSLVRAGARPEQIAAGRAIVAQLEARALYLDDCLSRLVVRSPIAGVVVGRRLEEQLHRRVARGDTFCEIHDRSSLRARISIDPDEPLEHIAVGDSVALRLLGDPNRPTTSRLVAIEPKRDDSNAQLVVESEPLPTMFWPAGASGHARIYLPPRTMAYVFIGAPVLRLLDYKAWLFWG